MPGVEAFVLADSTLIFKPQTTIMKVAINYTDTEKTLISQLEFFEAGNRWEFVKRNVSDLLPEKILSLCCSSFDIPTSDLLGKINHADLQNKIRKLAFYAGMFVFSNKDTADLEKFANYKGHLLYSAVKEMLYAFKRENKTATDLMKFFVSLHKACPARLNKLTEVDFSMAKGVEDWSDTITLNAYAISKIPLQDVSWFYNNNKAFQMLAFSTIKGYECKFITFERTSDHLIFYALQRQGYRFVMYGDHKKYQHMHHICDRCIHANNCLNKKAQYFGGFENFRCFEALPGYGLKVDLQLLSPFQQYQLQ